jgi:uncharacterized protein YndB with AHSA1/START domain
MAAHEVEASLAADREIVLSRVFDAPRALVWKVWADPEHISRWWGPIGFTTTTIERDLRPGGVWRFVFRGPDGREYMNLVTYLEVVEPERLAYKHGGEVDLEPVNFHVLVTFEEVSAGKTKLTMRSTFPSSKARDFVLREYNALEGGKQTLTRLGEYLEAMSRAGESAAAASDRPFAISRVFEAPRERIFTMWTEPEHLTAWFGPKGCPVTVHELDLRPGGTFLYSMRFPQGDIFAKWVFREVSRPKRLVFVLSFTDSAGTITPAPMAAGWPLEMLSTVTFVEHAGIGRGTVVQVESIPLHATPAERKVFEAGHDSMRQGWTGTLDQLAAYLARA